MERRSYFHWPSSVYQRLWKYKQRNLLPHFLADKSDWNREMQRDTRLPFKGMQTEWDKVRPIGRITLLTLHMVWMPMSRAVKLGPQDIVVGIDIFLLRCMLMVTKVTKFLQKCPPLWFECSHQWEVTNESSVILMAVQKGMEGVDAQVEGTARRKSGADDCTGD